MRSRLLAAAILAATGVSATGVSAGTVDCGMGATTCELPGNTTVINGGGGDVQLALDNGVDQWRMLSNSAAFGIGPVTGGAFPLLISEGGPSNSLRIHGSGNIGIGTNGPASSVHVIRSNSTAKILVEEDQAAANPGAPQVMFEIRRNGAARFDINDESAGGVAWAFQSRNGDFDISSVGNGIQEFKLDEDGDLTISGALTQMSDVNSKEDFQVLDGGTVLASISRLPITTWRYKHDREGARHIGPTAQDFRAAFDVGADEKTIAPLDVASVAVAGVKELNAIVESQKTELAAKDAELAAMNDRVAELEESVDRLMSILQHAAR